jgi:hypothetical protein
MFSSIIQQIKQVNEQSLPQNNGQRGQRGQRRQRPIGDWFLVLLTG